MRRQIVKLQGLMGIMSMLRLATKKFRLVRNFDLPEACIMAFGLKFYCFYRLDFNFATENQVVGVKLVFQQLYGQLIKRLRFSSRNFLVLVAQVILPMLIFAAGLIINKTLPGPSASPRLELSLKPFSPAVIYTAGKSKLHECFLRNNQSLTENSVVIDFGQLSEDEFLDRIVNETNRIGLSTFDLHQIISLFFGE